MLTLYTVAVILLLFGATIFVHELGHFLVARRCGMVVEVFSIGFGPAIWKTKRNGVVYKIGIIPFGGYVALPQMDPSGPGDKAAEEKKKDLPRMAPWKKILVALAGVTGNMIFAFFLAYLVFWIGKPSAPHERNCIIGFVDTNSAAYSQGLRIGDEITAIDAESIRNWDDLTLACAIRKSVRLNVKFNGGEKSITVPTEKNWMGVWAVDGIGWMNFCSVAGVVAGSSAEKAGIKAGDTILSLDGQKLFSREHMISLVTEARDRSLQAVVRRQGKDLDVTVTPGYDEKAKRALIGVVFNTMDFDYDMVVHPRPAAQIRDSATMIFRLLRALVTPREAKAASQAVGGPVAILVMYWWTVQNSFMLALWFTMMLNVNLAIINLLPIPVVDGGHIMFSLWELVTRRPISAKIVNFIMNAFAGLLIGVFLMLTYRDFARLIVPLFFRGGAPAAEQVTNAAPAQVQSAK
jgi:regulator of sigma E protease